MLDAIEREQSAIVKRPGVFVSLGDIVQCPRLAFVRPRQNDVALSLLGDDVVAHALIIQRSWRDKIFASKSGASSLTENFAGSQARRAKLSEASASCAARV